MQYCFFVSFKFRKLSNLLNVNRNLRVQKILLNLRVDYFAI